MNKVLVTGFTLLSLALLPTLARADGGPPPGDPHGGPHGGPPPGSVIVVHHGYHHPGPPPVRYYHGNALADLATFAIFAGVTYAIVDNTYYRQQGNKYVYVQNPPAGSYTVVNNPTTTTVVKGSGGLTPGTVVDEIVGQTKKVAYQGRLYYIANGVWYLPVDGGSQFVVVQPRY
ncbi:hypothetical protein [Gallaecimonas mangrovi]|uniref:hypothetical protein n=1 Tax=Gallaecimonas mangrovi TaxID=2291597 RepID=UPI000E20438B|nr:hypothetical protein [Gallaecimonas mangrovi]